MPKRFPGVLTATALADPVEAARAASEHGAAVVGWLTALAALSMLGLATLPRQLRLLSAAMPPMPDALLTVHHATLKGGIVRLITADRLVPSPTVLLAGVLIAVAAESVLAVSEQRRAAVWAVIALGLAPLLVERIGELAISYLVPEAATVRPGDVIRLPHRFITGPLLLWRSVDPAPDWLEALNPRANLITLWAVALWAVGLRELSGAKKLQSWHLLLPIAALMVAGVVTWASGPLVVGMILRAG